jgi:hypothetical protein
MTSAGKVETWRDEILATAKKTEPSTAIEDSIALNHEESMDKLFFDGAVLLVKPSTDSEKLTFLHHVTILEKMDKTNAYVALEGISSKATPIEIDWKDCLQKVRVEVPSKEDSEQPVKSYQILKLQTVPPLLQEAFLNAKDFNPSNLLSLATKIQENERQTADASATQNLIDFLSIAADETHSKRIEMDTKPSYHEEILEWCSNLHQQHLLAPAPKSMGEGKKPRTWEESLEALVEYKKVS